MRPSVSIFAVVVVSLGVVLGTAASARAQSTRRPDLNPFGRGLRDPTQSLSVGANLGASFYDTITRPPTPPGVPLGPDHGWGSFGSVGLSYRLRLLNVTFDGSVGAAATYYPALEKPFRIKSSPGAGASTGYSWALSDKTQVTLGASLRFRPLYAEAIAPGLGGGGVVGNEFAAGADPNSAFLPRDQAFVDGSYLSYGADSSIRHTLSRRWSVGGTYNIERDDAFGVDPLSGFGTRWGHQLGGAVYFSATRNLTVRGGYRYDESHIRGTAYRTTALDLGADYGRGVVLQLARRTRLTMSGGAGGFVDRAGNQHYRLNGDVSLQHDFRRSWSSGVRYGRGIDSRQVIFTGPVLTDTFNAFTNGNLSRNVGAHVSAVVQGGALAFGSPDTTSLRSGVGAGLKTSLGRRIAVGVDYSYYYYRFDSAIALPTGLAARSSSQGVYGYLSTSVPIFQRGGRRDASR